MHTKTMKNIVLSDSGKEGQQVQIKVVSGPSAGKEFLAKKVQETVEGVTVNCFHVTDGAIKTYFHEKDVTVI